MENYNEISIKDMLEKLWKKKLIVIVIIIMSIFIGIIYTLIMVKPMYKSDTQILIDKNDLSIEMFCKNYEIENEISANLNISPSQIHQNVTIKFDKATKIIDILAIADNPNMAYNIVNEYIKVIQPKLAEVYEVELYNNLQQPKIEGEPYNIDYKKSIGISAIIGLIISGIYIIFIANTRGTLEIIEASKLICLGKMSKEKDKGYISKREDTINELKKIIANVEFSKVVKKPNSIFVTGVEDNVGASYVTANLALRYARSGKKVLIIDSDFNKGVQSKIFNIQKDKVGLTEIISRIKEVEIIDISRYTNEVEENVFIMPSGATIIEEEMFVSDKAQKILDLLKRNFDIILIDGKTVIKSSSSIIWSNAADATIIVVEDDNTKMKDLMEVKESIEAINGKISGVILNKVVS